MLFQVNGFQILQKASDNDDVILVDIVANHLTEDTDGETILKEAFNDEAVKEFLAVGDIEFWHDSRNPHLNKQEQMDAIIGKPVGFNWKDGKPVVTAALTKSHKIVQSMLPHLQAKQAVYGASVGGSKMVLETKDSEGKSHKIIPKIKWDHLAIAPARSVINRAGGMNVQLMQKAKEIMCEFDDINSFYNNIANVSCKEEVLIKALTAPGSVGDMGVNGTSGGVITKQSLEPTIANLTLSDDDGLDLIDTFIKFKEKKIPANKKGYLKYFELNNKKDFGHKSYDLINKYFKIKRSKQNG